MYEDDLQLGKLKENCLLLKLYRKLCSCILFMTAFAMAYYGVNLSMFYCTYSYRETAFSQSKLTFSKCYFIFVPREILMY